MQSEPKDDAVTLAAMGILAFVFADMTHEAVGHGLATLLVGGQPVLLTTSYFSSAGTYSRWIPAAGGIANVIAGMISVVALRLLHRSHQALRFFLILCAAFNLLFAAAYPFYSGIAAFGDWAAVIAGLSPTIFWRALLVFLSAGSYFAVLIYLAHAIQPFSGDGDAALSRIRRITLLPFLAALAIACIGGAFNPRGWTNIFTAAAPAAAASFGFTQLDRFKTVRSPVPIDQQAGLIPRLWGWIVAAAVVAAIFVGIVGPGIKFTQR